MTVITLCNQEVLFSGTFSNNVKGRSGVTFYAIQIPEGIDQHEKLLLEAVSRMANFYNTSRKKDELAVLVVIRDSSNEIHLREKSSFLKDLGILLGCKNIHLKLTLSGLSFLNNNISYSGSRQNISGKLCTKEMAIRKSSETVCADIKIEFPFPSTKWLNLFCSDSKDIRCNVTLEAIFNHSNQPLKLPDPKSARMTTHRKMLIEEIHSDTIIVAKNGQIMKTHKAILSACSTVFEAMFQTDMVEARTHQIEMPDMTGEGLKAFLAYIYYLNEEDADKNCSIAFELLNAGHKYNVLPDLEKAMITLMLQKPADWYDVDVAIQTFALVRNLESGENLKTKCVQVLKTKTTALCDSEAYKNLFKKDTAAAMDLCQLSLSTKC